MFFFAPIFSFPQEGKIRFYLCCKKHEFCFWIFFLSSYKHFLSHSGHLHSIVNFYKPFHLHPRNIVLPYIADTFKKLPKVTLKNPPFRSVHIDLTFAQLIFSRPKSLRQINTKRKKKPKATKVFATFLEGSTIAFLFLFKRRSVFYDGMKSEANEMTNGRNI